MTKKIDCFIADLTHNKLGIHNKCFPLGTGLVTEYAKQELNDIIEFTLFKYPEELEEQTRGTLPKILALSNYAWNQELSLAFAKAYKLINPEAIIIFGGPNFPFSNDERNDYLKLNHVIDFYIFGEGEFAFVKLLKLLNQSNYDATQLKSTQTIIDNCSYIYNNDIYSGDYLRIKNVEALPSPYLNGTFDKYFDDNLIPLYETTRGCPFSCTFCSDGVKEKSKTYRYSRNTINQHLEFIAKNIKKSDSLIITDLNFGMYPEDIETCEKIAETQKKYNYPIFFAASAGKSKFENILKSVKILDGSWIVGASVQSMDKEVLKSIKRKNLPLEKMVTLANVSNEDDSVSYTEIILALPNDTKKKHFESLKVGVDAGLNSIKMYQLMLLIGTEMNSQESIDRYKMNVKFRVMPGAFGEYTFFNKQYRVAEFERIVIQNSTLSYKEYIECRLMNLIIEIFINNAMFSELYYILEKYNISTFDILEKILENKKSYSLNVQKVFNSFIEDTTKDMFDTHKEIEQFIQKEGIIEKHISGKLGNNEILDHKALSYLYYSDFISLLLDTIKSELEGRTILTQSVEECLNELVAFMILKNQDFRENTNSLKKEFHYDFSLKDFDSILSSKSQSRVYHFYHTDEQKEILSSLIDTYNGYSTAGLGRLIQRSNLKLLYRKYNIIG